MICSNLIEADTRRAAMPLRAFVRRHLAQWRAFQKSCPIRSQVKYVGRRTCGQSVDKQVGCLFNQVAVSRGAMIENENEQRRRGFRHLDGMGVRLIYVKFRRRDRLRSHAAHAFLGCGK